MSIDKAQQHLTIGMKIKVLEKSEVIDEAIIRRARIGENPLTQEIEAESLKLHPGKITEFAFIQDSDPDKQGWRMLFENPMGRGRCFSKRAPTYVFEDDGWAEQ